MAMTVQLHDVNDVNDGSICGNSSVTCCAGIANMPGMQGEECGNMQKGVPLGKCWFVAFLASLWPRFVKEKLF